MQAYLAEDPAEDVSAQQGWLASIVVGGPDDGMPACSASGVGDVRATAQGVLGLYGATYPALAGLQMY